MLEKARPEVHKLRRFALAVGLILLTYTLSGISMVPEATVTPFGVPFRLIRPELLPIGLALAALYSAARYYYYAFLITKSPYRLRQHYRDELRHNSESLEDLNELYPRLARQRVEMKWVKTGDSANASGVPIVPLVSRVGAALEDIDYAAPVWLPLVALGLYGWSQIAG